MAEKTGRESTREYRDRRRRAGYREATVWLDPDLNMLIDQEITNGRYQSRSDALSAAVHAFFKEKHQTMT